MFSGDAGAIRSSRQKVDSEHDEESGKRIVVQTTGHISCFRVFAGYLVCGMHKRER